MALIVLMAAWEWTAMMRLVSRTQRTVYILAVLFAIVVVQKTLPYVEWAIFFVASVWWLIATISGVVPQSLRPMVWAFE